MILNNFVFYIINHISIIFNFNDWQFNIYNYQEYIKIITMYANKFFDSKEREISSKYS